jgi:hypothetical protein
MRGAPDVLELPRPPTTVLGDWYANILFARPAHLVLALSERSLLPVVVPAKDVKRLPERIAHAAQCMLRAIGVPEKQVAAEALAMSVGYLAVTNNRKVLGSLNDFVFHLELSLQDHLNWELHEHALQLAEMPSGAIEYAVPSEATRVLFASSQAIQAAKSAA